ncbi:MAG: sugar phosphate isomerase/epimerase [Deltaproteobacteria bacterium]|nr:sugar phosphate isomerase/epimerase [Deltaproteobacteria bacterium]MBW1924312.1 sugar phosphate isomerase/epimerase [Deltaproteobacteria bacterium]MBW1950140.1 sugar phosphate isomerase/epimerase [Deltaproteobacteria bacterium]MBW2009343.1 sugar phosphate isomerase/epimerase [Deltaproteobacteria bacterium]MBW2348555.1 sugar phosphate isomerase/epimerase [Deltaproteobacteria bacterium]
MLYGAMNFPVSPVIQELETLAALGFDYLELTMDPPRAHHRIIREQKEVLLETLERHGMKLVCHLPTFVSTADLTPSLRETSLREVMDSLSLAAELGALKAVLHPSYITGLALFVREEARAYAMESLELLVERAEKLGLLLCLENLFPNSHSLVDPEHFTAVFDRFPGLKLTLDTGHAHIRSSGRNKSLQFIERFGDRIAHVHASDNFGKEDSHLPIGAGTVDFRAVIGALKAIGYDETVTFEVFSPDRDYLRISREKFHAMMHPREKTATS